MFESIVQQLAGGGAQNMPSDQVHGHLDSLLGNADSGQATGAVNEALQALGAGGFAHSVEGAAQNMSPEQRNQVGSLLTGAIEQGGGNPSSVMSNLGIGGSGNMGSGELGALAHYVASNHGGELSGLLGGLSSGGSGGSGNQSSGLGGEVVHLLGEPMVQQTAMNLAKRFL